MTEASASVGLLLATALTLIAGKIQIAKCKTRVWTMLSSCPFEINYKTIKIGYEHGCLSRNGFVNLSRKLLTTNNISLQLK